MTLKKTERTHSFKQEEFKEKLGLSPDERVRAVRVEDAEILVETSSGDTTPPYKSPVGYGRHP